MQVANPGRLFVTRKTSNQTWGSARHLDVSLTGYFRGISGSFCSEMEKKKKKVTVTQNARSESRLNTVAVTMATGTDLATFKPPAGASGLQSNFISAPEDDYCVTWPALASKNVTEAANCCCHEVFHLTAFGEIKMTTEVWKMIKHPICDNGTGWRPSTEAMPCHRTTTWNQHFSMKRPF